MLIGQLKSIVQRNAMPMSKRQIIIWYKNVSIQIGRDPESAAGYQNSGRCPAGSADSYSFALMSHGENPLWKHQNLYLWFLINWIFSIDVWIILSEISYQDVHHDSYL